MAALRQKPATPRFPAAWRRAAQRAPGLAMAQQGISIPRRNSKQPALRWRRGREASAREESGSDAFFPRPAAPPRNVQQQPSQPGQLQICPARKRGDGNSGRRITENIAARRSQNHRLGGKSCKQEPLGTSCRAQTRREGMVAGFVVFPRIMHERRSLELSCAGAQGS